MNWLKITFWDDDVVSYIRPHQIVYVQRYTKPRLRIRPNAGDVSEQLAFGEIIAINGVFIIWKETEAKDIWRQLGITDGSSH